MALFGKLFGQPGAWRQPFEFAFRLQAQLRQHGPAPVHRVRPRAGAFHGGIVPRGGTVAVLVQSNGVGAVGGPSVQGAAGEALQVDDHVKFFAAQGSHADEPFGQSGRRAPAATVERVQRGDVRIALEQRGKGFGNPPVHLPIGALAFDEAQDGQRVDDVTEGTGLEDEDLHARPRG